MADEIFDAYLRTLRAGERMPPAALAAYQDELRRRLVEHAYAECPFYRDRLSVLFDAEGSIDLARWHDVPILKRAAVRDALPDMAARQLPPVCGAVTRHQTSGSEGVSISFDVNGLARLAYNADLTMLALRHGLSLPEPMAQIRIFQSDDGPQYPEGWHKKGWSHAEPKADNYQLEMRTPVEQQIEWLLRTNCRYLMTLPSNALALAFACTPEQARALDLKAILSISETVLPGVREIIAQRLGAKLIAIYSTEEVGSVASECPEYPHYHQAAETTLVEIVDEAGQPAASNTIGRVLLTSLYNYATPFIRYEIGDSAIASDVPCGCGRTAPVLTQVLGRTRHAFVFRDGRRLWLRVWNAQEIERLMPCREFQLAQRDYDAFEFRFVPRQNLEGDTSRLIAYLHDQLGANVAITLVPLLAIPRGPGGKFDPFVSEIRLED